MASNNNTQGPVWPNFLILGAAKAGTTALYNYLRQHPDIYMPEKKEPGFFSMYKEELSLPITDTTSLEYQVCANLYHRVLKNSVTDPAEYTALFSDAQTETALGEATTSNLYFPGAAENIQHFIPDAKLIAILRNPVDRAFSGFLHAVRKNHEQRDFREALEQEPVDSDFIWWGNGDYYIRPGFYSKQLSRYFERFDREQIKIVLYDDLTNDPQTLVRELFGFLGVDESFQLDVSRKHNVSAVADGLSSSVFRLAHRLATSSKPMNAITNAVKKSLPAHWKKRLGQSHRSVRLQEHLTNVGAGMETERVGQGTNSFVKPKLEPETRRWLTDIYRDDILQLQDMLQRDLSAWLKDDNSVSRTA
jgi:hypothetical protein